MLPKWLLQLVTKQHPSPNGKLWERFWFGLVLWNRVVYMVIANFDCQAWQFLWVYLSVSHTYLPLVPVALEALLDQESLFDQVDLEHQESLFHPVNIKIINLKISTNSPFDSLFLRHSLLSVSLSFLLLWQIHCPCPHWPVFVVHLCAASAPWHHMLISIMNYQNTR